jgi:hypothetical protein
MQRKSKPRELHSSGDVVEQLRRGEVAGVPLAGHRTAFYERHLEFDSVMAPDTVGTRERFEAFAHSALRRRTISIYRLSVAVTWLPRSRRPSPQKRSHAFCIPTTRPLSGASYGSCRNIS